MSCDPTRLRIMIEARAKSLGVRLLPEALDWVQSSLEWDLTRHQFSEEMLRITVDRRLEAQAYRAGALTNLWRGLLHLVPAPAWIREQAPKHGHLSAEARSEISIKLAKIYRPASLGDTLEVLLEAEALVLRFLELRTKLIADFVRNKRAPVAYSATLHPEISSVHVEAPTDGGTRRRTRSVSIPTKAWRALEQSPFWRLRYPPNSFTHPAPPIILRVWLDDNPGAARFHAILFKTSIAIGRPDCVTFMLIVNTNNHFQMLRNYNLDCQPTSFSSRLVLGKTLTYADLPNLELRIPHLDKPQANAFIERWGQMRSGKLPFSFGYYSTRHSNTAERFENFLFRPHLKGLSPSNLARELDRQLLSLK